MTKKIFRAMPPDPTNPTTSPTSPGGLDWWTLD